MFLLVQRTTFVGQISKSCGDCRMMVLVCWQTLDFPDMHVISFGRISLFYIASGTQINSVECITPRVCVL